jgi:hypothetical protein
MLKRKYRDLSTLSIRSGRSFSAVGPVRPVRETFASYGSRERDVYRKLPFRQLHGAFTVVSLRVRWVPLYRFPTLSLRAFAVSPRPGVPSFPGFRLLCPI